VGIIERLRIAAARFRAALSARHAPTTNAV